MPQKKLFFAVIDFFLLIVACTNNDIGSFISTPDNSPTGLAAFRIPVAANSCFSNDADSAEAIVSADNMVTIKMPLTISDTSVTGVIKKIPAGNNRCFEINVYDSLHILRYYGCSICPVFHDSTIVVDIIIRRVGNAIINGIIEEDEDQKEDTSLYIDLPFSGDATDHSGNGNHGIVFGATLSTDRNGKIENAYYFDGSDDYIYVDTIDFNTPCAVSLWFKSTEINPSWHTIFSWNNHETDPYFEGIQIHADNFGKIEVRMGTKYDDEKIISVIDGDSEWHHILAQKDKDNLVEVYVDGSLEISKTVSNSFGSRHPLFIGRYHQVGIYDHFFKGWIDDIKVYKRILSHSEISSIVCNDSIKQISSQSKSDLIIQPGPNSAQDCHIQYSYDVGDGGSWCNHNNGKNGGFAVGSYDKNTVMRALISFKLPADLSKENIKSAHLVLSNLDWDIKDTGTSFTISVHKMLRFWKSGNYYNPNYRYKGRNSATIDGATGLERFYGNQDGSEDWNKPNVGIDNVDASEKIYSSAQKEVSDESDWEFEITELVKEWASNPSNNFGMLLRSPTDQGVNGKNFSFPHFHSGESEFENKRPKLIIRN